MSHRIDVAPVLRTWASCDLGVPGNLWKRRVAILSQNAHKQSTDVDFLFEVIEPSIRSKEFFLRKAIGWALRDLTKVNEDVVVAFVATFHDQLSGLSKREALKHLGPDVRRALA